MSDFLYIALFVMAIAVLSALTKKAEGKTSNIAPMKNGHLKRKS